MAIWNILPGETPIDDISGLKIKGITTRKQLSFSEAENILEATEKYLAGLFRGVPPAWPCRGAYDFIVRCSATCGHGPEKPRQENLNLGSAWHQVEGELQDLLDDLAYWEVHWPDVLEQAVHLHYRSVRIHPFMNGNGRWSRMLANIWLRLQNAQLPCGREQTIGTVSPIRSEYLNTLRSADNGDIAPLMELHERFSDTTDPYRPMDDKPVSGRCADQPESAIFFNPAPSRLSAFCVGRRSRLPRIR